jgi:aspartate/methionine/tyrosine aminotransferase
MFNGNARDMANQATQLANDAQQLAQQIQASGGTQSDRQAMDEVAKALRALGDVKAYRDPEGLAQLSQAAADKLKQAEFNLRKKADTTSNQLFLSGSDQVPANFQALVEAYSRALSNSKKKGGGQ